MTDQTNDTPRERILKRLDYHVTPLPMPEKAPRIERWKPESAEDQANYFAGQLAMNGIELVPCNSGSLGKKLLRHLSESPKAKVTFSAQTTPCIKAAYKTLQKMGVPCEMANEPDQLSSDIAIVEAHSAAAETGTVLLWHDKHLPQSFTTQAQELIIFLRRPLLKNYMADCLSGTEWRQVPGAVTVVSGQPTHHLLGFDAPLSGLGPQTITLFLATPKNTGDDELADSAKANKAMFEFSLSPRQ